MKPRVIKKKKSVTICSSAAFFKQALEVEKQLKKMGFTVKLPHTASKMKKSGDFRIKTYKTWFKDPENYSRKAWLMRKHFKKVKDGDAVLVLNYEKKGIRGYIGGNVLMEAALSFHYKKPIYILNPISDDLGFKEEILGLQPIFLNGDLKKIKQ